MKSRNNVNIYRMDGIGKVFGFTLRQTFKNKGYLFSYILMIAMMTFMGPISMISASASEKAVESADSMKSDNNVSSVYILNNTDVVFTENDLELDGTGFEKANISFIDNASGMPQISDEEIAVYIETENDEKGSVKYTLKSVISEDSQIAVLLLDDFTDYIFNRFEDKRISRNMTEEQIALTSGSVSAGKVFTKKDYFESLEAKVPSSQMTIYSTVYSIIIMILVSLTVSYVITSVMEEKTSKLVENLLVSVRPLALIMGKIFAMMLYVISMLVFGGIGASVSTGIISLTSLSRSQAVSEMGQHMDFTVLFGFSVWKLLILLLSVLVTYLMFSILAGLLGSACTKVEDVGSTVMIINFLSIAGYISGMVVPALDIKPLGYILSIIPFFSSYIGPIYFVCGRIPFYIYLIGLVLQILFIAWLFTLTAKVYRKLIVNDSRKLKISEILKLAKEGE